MRSPRSMAALLLLAAMQAAAADYPAKPVRLILTTGPGTAPDLAGRVVAQKLAEGWGQPLVVENISGAGGNIGMERAAKAAPDGYTIVLASFGPLFINRTLYEGKLAYDVERDFEPVSEISRTYNILVVHPAVAAHTVDELVAYGRAHPGKLRFGSAGNGTSMHICAELLKAQAGIEALHVPYRTGAQLNPALVAGEFEFAFQNASLALPYVRSGHLRALAVTAPNRLSQVPDIPAITEAKLSVLFEGGIGFLVPKGTPASIIEKIQRDTLVVLRHPTVVDQLAGYHQEAVEIGRAHV